MAKELSVAVVLGCPSSNVSFYERVKKAVELYHNGAVQKILFTGGNVDPHKKVVSQAYLMSSAALMQGVAKKDMLLEVKSKNTVGNAVNSLPILREIKPSKILVVTNRYHAKSAMRIFRQAGYLEAFSNITFVSVIGDPLRRDNRRKSHARKVADFRKTNNRPKRKP